MSRLYLRLTGSYIWKTGYNNLYFYTLRSFYVGMNNNFCKR